jgi:hypothetical protein
MAIFHGPRNLACIFFLPTKTLVVKKLEEHTVNIWWGVESDRRLGVSQAACSVMLEDTLKLGTGDAILYRIEINVGYGRYASMGSCSSRTQMQPSSHWAEIQSVSGSPCRLQWPYFSVFGWQNQT